MCRMRMCAFNEKFSNIKKKIKTIQTSFQYWNCLNRLILFYIKGFYSILFLNKKKIAGQKSSDSLKHFNGNFQTDIL